MRGGLRQPEEQSQISVNREIQNFSKELDLEISTAMGQRLAQNPTARSPNASFSEMDNSSSAFMSNVHNTSVNTNSKLPPKMSAQNQFASQFANQFAKPLSGNKSSVNIKIENQSVSNFEHNSSGSAQHPNAQMQFLDSIDNSISNNYVTNQSYVSGLQNTSQTFDEDSMLSKVYRQQCKACRAIQTEMVDEALFPPFDKRICLRCKKNDMISPNYCKYDNIQSIDELSVSTSSKHKVQYKVSKAHIYGTQLGWVGARPKSKTSLQQMYCQPSYQSSAPEQAEAATNTIISTKDFSGNFAERRNNMSNSSAKRSSSFHSGKKLKNQSFSSSCDRFTEH